MKKVIVRVLGGVATVTHLPEGVEVEIIDHDSRGEIGECDTCGKAYDPSSRWNRCGECGDCGECCEHAKEWEAVGV